MGRKRHRLSSIDSSAMTAHCAVCGPVPVYSRSGRGYMCAPSQRERVRAYRQTPAGRLTNGRAYLGARGDHCERCGWSPLSARALCVHHVDQDHGNDERGNLVTYCLGCHAEVHAQLQAQLDAFERTRPEDYQE